LQFTILNENRKLEIENLIMVKPSHILGINARNQLYTSLNSKESKRFGFSKLRTKKFVAKHGIGVATLYGNIRRAEELKEFDWDIVKGGFAIKPGNGSAGKGIVVIKRRDKKTGVYIDINEKYYSVRDLELHIRDILQGAYSTWGSENSAIIEERIPVHPDLEPYVEVGTPDVRVIVFNNIPVMAECRIPTHSSQGKANLHQGAIGLGIDFGTGQTTYGISGLSTPVSVFPHTQTSVKGINIPLWTELLKTAVRTANATGFMYCGVDLFMHPEKGPMVAEINGFPGLGIQIANHAGLRKRLERVEEIQARNVSHAVRIAQALFAENYIGSGSDAAELTIIQPKNDVLIYDDHEHGHEYVGLVNTGRFRSAISRQTAKKLGLLDGKGLLWNQEIEGEGKVPVIEVKFKLRDRVVNTTMLVSKKLDGKSHGIEIGRRDLRGFLVGVNE
jgi:alpha-L-glutamate ligase-like protein